MQNHTIFKVIIVHAGATIRLHELCIYYQTRYDDAPYHQHHHHHDQDHDDHHMIACVCLLHTMPLKMIFIS